MMPACVERWVEADGATLYAEGFCVGRSRTAVLLAGAAMQATAWEEPTIAALLDAGVGVVRFDWRDIGRSTWRPFSEAPYAVETLRDDVFAVADAFGLDRFDVVGFSMGGCIAQLVALERPARVSSLALLSSGFASVIEAERPERGRALFELFAQPRPADDAEAVDRLVEQWRLLCGEATTFDQLAWRERARSWVARGQNPRCPHVRLGPQVFGVDRRRQLEEVTVPTLVLHGTDDPMFPHPHGVAIAETLPRVALDLFDGRGHDLLFDPRAIQLVASHLTGERSA
jgi:pimeloyl-ACP methyl ester carboxylesterase